MKNQLSYSDKLILVRNQNEIREIVNNTKAYISQTKKDISDLREQSREILGRGKK